MVNQDPNFLEELPTPQLVEELTVEANRDNFIRKVMNRVPGIAVRLTDPFYQIAVVGGGYVFLFRQLANQLTMELFPKYAKGATLDNLASWFGLKRTQGQTDEALRRLTYAAPHQQSTVTPNGVIANAYKANPDEVFHVSFNQEFDPSIGAVYIVTDPTVDEMGVPLGTPSDELVAQVQQYLIDPSRIAVGQLLQTRKPTITEYYIDGTIRYSSGIVTEQELRTNVEAAIAAWVREFFKLNGVINISTLYETLQDLQGVNSVDITTLDIVKDSGSMGNIPRDGSRSEQVAYILARDGATFNYVQG